MVEIYWDDLTEEKQREILEVFGDNQNFDQFPVAMTYTPWQRWCEPYCAQKGLERGTIFPDLDLPFAGRRC